MSANSDDLKTLLRGPQLFMCSDPHSIGESKCVEDFRIALDNLIGAKLFDNKTLDAIAAAMTERLQTYYEAPLKVRISK